MVISCVVVGCVNRFRKGSGLKFHRIPTDSERRQRWLQAIKRKNSTPEHSGDRVCGDLFSAGTASSDQNDPDYVPHVKMGYAATSMATPEAKKDRYLRVRQQGDAKLRQEHDRQEKDSAASILLELSLNTSNTEVQGTPQEEKENASKADIHEPCLQKILTLQKENRQLLQEVTFLQEELRDVKYKLDNVRFGDKFLAGDNKDAKTVFYTGVPSHAAFLCLVQFCSSVLPTSMMLNPASVLLLILMKLRLNSADQDLAYRLGVSRQHVSDLINTALPSLANKLAFFIHWPDKEEVARHMPKVIKTTYKTCRVIIDCCEIFIERPGNLTARAMTWSNYKGHNTIKLLVAVSPVGAVTFVSRAFGGRVSDKVITQRSGFLQL